MDEIERQDLWLNWVLQGTFANGGMMSNWLTLTYDILLLDLFEKLVSMLKKVSSTNIHLSNLLRLTNI